MAFPYQRKRINRASHATRELMAENHLTVNDFIVPLFIMPGENKKEEIHAMPDYYRFSLDLVLEEIQELWNLGLKAVLLFVMVEEHEKDNTGVSAANPNGLMQKSIKAIKSRFPDLLVMTDVALDPYSSFGHDGIVEEGKIVNDKTSKALVNMAISHIKAGADWVAPSDMMDGRIAAIRQAFNEKGWEDKGILAYTAKYASNLYGPFRIALDSAPGFGDKKSYQMDFRNSKEALHEAELDIVEGADMIMVKPGSWYLDVVKDLSNHSNIPVSAYQVSGEYAMIKTAANAGFLNYRESMLESLYAFKRAGAQVILSYFAKEVAELIQQGEHV